MTEDEMVGWHHQLNQHEFEQALGVGDGQGSQSLGSQVPDPACLNTASQSGLVPANQSRIFAGTFLT